jgi:uncharacterized protein DUF6542
MLEPSDQSSAGRVADSDGETRSGTRRSEPVAPERRQARGKRPAWRRIPAWGRFPAWAGVLMVVIAATLGAVFTVASHRDAGQVLGTFVVAGTLVAVTLVRARSAYAIIPVPALAYAVAAGLAVSVQGRGGDSTRTLLAVNAVQWMSDGFLAMTAATALALLVTLARWILSRRATR